MLAEEFLACRVGSASLYYDALTERMLHVTDEQAIRPIHFRVRHWTRTIIKRTRNPY